MLDIGDGCRCECVCFLHFWLKLFLQLVKAVFAAMSQRGGDGGWHRGGGGWRQHRRKYRCEDYEWQQAKHPRYCEESNGKQRKGWYGLVPIVRIDTNCYVLTYTVGKNGLPGKKDRFGKVELVKGGADHNDINQSVKAVARTGHKASECTRPKECSRDVEITAIWPMSVHTQKSNAPSVER